MSTRCAAAILFLTTLITGNAQAATFLQYVSPAGVLYANGLSETLVDPAYPMNLVSSPSGVSATVNRALLSTIQVQIGAPSGQLLAVGTYQGAQSAADASHGMVSFGVPSGCPGFGQFTILEIAVDSSQHVSQLAVDFQFQCEGDDRVSYGGLRVNSATAYVPQAPLQSPTFIQYFSQTGDGTGGGRSGTITRNDGYFSGSPDLMPSSATVKFFGNSISRDAFWTLDFSPPGGGPLSPGTYSAAGMFLAVDGSGCSVNTGQFTVFEIEYGQFGAVRKFAADFEAHCNGAVAGLFGVVRYNSAVPTSGPPQTNVAIYASMLSSTPLILARGAATAPFVVRADDINGHPIPGTPVTFDAGSCGTFNGSPRITVSADSSGLATTPAFLVSNVTTLCSITATVPGDVNHIGRALWEFRTYNPASLRLVPAASPIAVQVDTDYSITVEARADQPVMFELEIDFSLSGADGAMPVSLPGSALTDAFYHVVLNLHANSIPGTYDILARVGSVVLDIPVVQFADSPPPPPAPFTETVRLQDMWWSPAENGWGMSLVQHNDTLFGAMYIYDASGRPTWLVMPGGAWDATHTIYRGSVYTPSGTPFFAYDASRLVVGSAKGSVTITFQDANDAVLDYTIGGVSSRKLITREIFASGSVVAPDRSDLWWGGTPQNGWGITILQQASTLFPVWFTYDANGATWYVMPGGTWTSTDTYEGHVYRTTGSAWIGAGYDSTKLQVFDVGTYRIQFTGDNASFNYTVDGHTGTIPLVREPF